MGRAGPQHQVPALGSRIPARQCSSIVVVVAVDWTHGAEHMWSRHKITVAEAGEAIGDVDALWFDPDPHSRSGLGVRVIGYGHSRRTLLTVILVHGEDCDDFYGANGCGVEQLGSATVRKGRVMGAKRDVEVVQAESEATLDTPLPPTTRGERRGRSVVQSVRLPAEDFAEIERLADAAGVPISALIRGWVLSGLAAERGTSLRDAIEHLAGEAERLRRLAASSDVA